ncbi:MAG: triose-phosphate isomerase [Candidatus Kaiserbacteria bacterium]|nr:triose-phosphate isomerase [Candidatus Kaiserbacteria bacterium]
MKYLIANWKAQATLSEMILWIETFRELLHTDHTVQHKLEKKELTIIICPPFPYLLYIKNRFQDVEGITVGAQTVSHIKEGKYTGEVTAKALKDAATFSIVGHSERRSNFHESEDEIERKVSLCNQYHIEPILCVRSENDTIYEDVKIVAFETVEAIGTGKNEDVAHVLEMKQKMKVPAETSFLYGGSADEENMREYLDTGEVHGFIVGTASLDPREFFTMAQKM